MMKRCLMFLTAGAVGWTVLAAPLATVKGVTQRADREVVVTFSLANAPAIVTLTLFEGETPLAPSSVTTLAGDFGKRLDADGDYEIRWRADVDMPAHTFAAGTLKARLKAWPVEDPPDYLVVSLDKTCRERVRYYESADALPGGLLANDEYRLRKLVMRRIHGTGVATVKGGVETDPGYYANNEGGSATELTFDHDYYIGVFEVTLGQWFEMSWNDSDRVSVESVFTTDSSRRPAAKVYYSYLRGPDAGTLQPADDKPGEAPPSGSVLNRLRTRTGVAFDLPTESEWEFACRATSAYGCWNDGSSITNTANDLQMPGRHMYNGGCVYDESAAKWVSPPSNCDTNLGTAVVGSYAPNDWGLYDMHGNVGEWTRDYWAADVSALHGQLNTTQALSSGYGNHVYRGGYFAHPSKECKTTWRNGERTNNAYAGLGVRLVCPVGLTATAE